MSSTAHTTYTATRSTSPLVRIRASRKRAQRADPRRRAHSRRCVIRSRGPLGSAGRGRQCRRQRGCRCQVRPTTAPADATAAQASASQADTAAYDRMVAAVLSSLGLSAVDAIVPEPPYAGTGAWRYLCRLERLRRHHLPSITANHRR